MIDPSIINVGELMKYLLQLDHWSGAWRSHAEIIVDYMPPFPRPDTRPSCQVKIGDNFLRHSKGPLQRHFWDIYGDDYQTPELALIALMQADPPFKWVRSHADADGVVKISIPLQRPVEKP